MAILTNNPTNQLTTWQLPSPLFTSCLAQKCPDLKQLGQARLRPQRERDTIAPKDHQSTERRPSRKITATTLSRSLTSLKMETMSSCNTHEHPEPSTSSGDPYLL